MKKQILGITLLGIAAAIGVSAETINAAGATFSFTIQLQETAGVATTNPRSRKTTSVT